MKYIIGRERKQIKLGSTTLVIQEPTISEMAQWERAYSHADGEDLAEQDIAYLEQVAKQCLPEGEQVTIEALLAISACYQAYALEQVIEADPGKSEAKETQCEIADLSVLQELDLVSHRYGQSPLTLAEKITLRQLHYLYALSYNASLDKLEMQIALAGGKQKHRTKRLSLVGAELPESTAGMSVEEKAKFFGKQKLREQSREKAGKT